MYKRRKPKRRISVVEARHAWARSWKARDVARELLNVPRMASISDRALYRMGLISAEDYRVLVHPSSQFGSRWWSGPGTGRWMKRRLSKTRRRAWKYGARNSLRGAESDCNWKGT